MSSPADRTSGEVIVHVFGRTDVGRTREHNEDAFVVADLSMNNATLQPEVRTHPTGHKGSLFMVADGMGGAAAGEIASAMAVDVVLAQLRSTWVTEDSGGGEVVRSGDQGGDEGRERADQHLRDGASRVSRHGHDRDDRRAPRRHAVSRPGRRQPRVPGAQSASRDRSRRISR